MSLIEVLVLITILSLVGLGTTQLLRNMMEVQKKSNMQKVLLQTRDNMIQNLENDNAWANTVNAYGFSHASGLGCLRDNSTVPCPNGVNDEDFNIRTDGEGGGNMFYEGEDSTAGITPNGFFCSEFNAGAGNDDCPFRYDLSKEFICPSGEPSCQKPKIIIRGTFVTSPADQGGILSRLNLDVLNFEITKGARNRNEPILIRHFTTTNQGGGACPNGTGNVRLLNQLVEDAGGNVAAFDDSQSRFQLRKGEYECTITAQSYGIPNGYSITLRQIGGAGREYKVGSGFAPMNITDQVVGTLRLHLAEPGWFQVVQYCNVNPQPPGETSPFPNLQFDMGIPLPDYSRGSSYTKVSCMRTS